MSPDAPLVRELTCIQCPLGCRLKVEGPRSSTGALDPVSLSVAGNRCPKGDAWAREEVTDPRRVLTTSVRVRGGVRELASVKFREALPLGSLTRVMEVLRALSLPAPVVEGQELPLVVDGLSLVLVVTRPVDAADQGGEAQRG